MLWGNNTHRNTGKGFQSSSSPKAGCYVDILFCCVIAPVSILIQPEGWMLWASEIEEWLQSSFNPHPARRLDAMIIEAISASKDLFQSSSSPKAGCYAKSGSETWRVWCFNPHPARRLDAIHYVAPRRALNTRFNPHPARRLDAIKFLRVSLHS